MKNGRIGMLVHMKDTYRSNVMWSTKWDKLSGQQIEDGVKE